MIEPIIPQWPAPACIRALSTTRPGGVSQPPYDSLNLGAHVGDAADVVWANRERLVREAGLPEMPAWLGQIHGARVVDAGESDDLTADAIYTDQPGRVCAVMTADCLPVLLCSRQGDELCAAHAGWRGLFGGVLEAAVGRFRHEPAGLLCWLGPAIGPRAFEVGADVRDRARMRDQRLLQAFRECPEKPGHWLLDIYAAARILLMDMGVGQVYGGGECTLSDPGRFYSYRRDGRTGRMASLIWMSGENE